MKHGVLASLALAAACGAGPKPAAPSAPAATCASAAASSAQIGLDEQMYDDQERAWITKGTEAACARDAWSPELIACTDDATTSAQVADCRAQLTDAQREGLAAEQVYWPDTTGTAGWVDPGTSGITDTAGDGVDRDGKM